MALSDTARRILTAAAQYPLRLAAPPEKLPVAACRSVLNSLLKQGYVEECVAPDDLTGPRWQQRDGARLMVRITEAGMVAIGAAPNATATRPDTDAAPFNKSQEPDSAPCAAPTVPEPLESPASAEALAMRPSLRDVARRVLAAWDDEAGERAGLADAIATLRGIVVKTPPGARATGIRKPREATKQQQVLAMLRRPEGATVAQIAEATGWQAHTVRGVSLQSLRQVAKGPRQKGRDRLRIRRRPGTAQRQRWLGSACRVRPPFVPAPSSSSPSSRSLPGFVVPCGNCRSPDSA